MRVTRRESGFSLLEVMIAMVIIAFAIFAIMSMILGTMASQESLREMQTAKEAVAQKIEQVKSNTFQVAVATYPSGSSQLFPVPGLVDLNYFDKVARGTVTTQLDPSGSIMDILVSVSWKGRKGNTTYSMRSLYAK